MVASKKPLITVPTYWFSGKQRNYQIGDVFYDHPTPIDQEGTLARLLESLERLKGDFIVVVITSVIESTLEKEAEKKVEAIIRPFKSKYPIMQFGSEDLKMLKNRLKSLGILECVECINIRGYGNVRNIQLIIAQILGMDVVIGLDDDEVIIDEFFLEKALEHIGREHKGKFIGGIGGFYLNPENKEEALIDEKIVEEKNIFCLKKEIMNQTMKMLRMKPGRLVETPLILGGNMVIHKSLFQKVPFDPYIPRGEDIDYLINAKLLGYTFFLDKELSVLHLPPYTPSQLLQDIARFLYERYKLVMAKNYGMKNCPPESLDPYPGLFLRDDIEKHALNILQRKGLSLDFVNRARKYAQKKLPHFFEFMRKWPELMDALSKDNVLRRTFQKKLLVEGEYQ